MVDARARLGDLSGSGRASRRRERFEKNTVDEILRVCLLRGHGHKVTQERVEIMNLEVGI